MGVTKQRMLEEAARYCSECGAGPEDEHTNPPWCPGTDGSDPGCGECGVVDGRHALECSQRNRRDDGTQ